MRALKFLGEGGVGPFSGFRWPLPEGGAPGGWVEASEATRACSRGVHACLPADLPYWLAPELYVMELGGAVTRAELKLVAPRGRLLGRIEGWTGERARELAVAAVLHARDTAVAILCAEAEAPIADRIAACADVTALQDTLAGASPSSDRGKLALEYLDDAACSLASPAVSAYCAARVGLDRRGYLAERAWQAEWLARALGLWEALAG
ncbi:hypothetical protein AB3662_29575 [Sorangium cellulosum]|uniref:hypothetical protein n=1 Tax=Sorangium cellulosum TaxID=56 RepID=UPI003D9AB0FD